MDGPLVGAIRQEDVGPAQRESCEIGAFCTEEAREGRELAGIRLRFDHAGLDDVHRISLQ